MLYIFRESLQKNKECQIKERVESMANQVTKKTTVQIEIDETLKRYNVCNDLESRESFLLTTDGLKLIENMSRDNRSFVEIAVDLKLTQVSLRNFFDEHPELQDRLELGADKKFKDVENALFRSATGYDVEEVHINQRSVGGRVIENKDVYTKKVAPNPMSIQYLLNNKKRMEYKKEQQPSSLSEISGIKVIFEVNDGSNGE